MAFLDKLKEQIQQELKLTNVHFTYPPQANLGDISLVCFDIAKKQKSNPNEVAQELLEESLASSKLQKMFSDIKVVGPYLNFYINQRYLAEGVIREIKKEKKYYGHSKIGQNKQVMIEYSNANTHKEYHVGHLRNIAYGDSISNLLRANAYVSIPVSYINDFGIHIAKTLWNWQQHPEYKDSVEEKGYLLGKCYSEASGKLEQNPDHKEQVAKIMKQIESRNGDTYNLWQETRQWSIDYFSKIYEELGIKFKDTFYESEVIENGLKIVQELLDDGILKKSEGAIIANLEEYNLGILPIVRSDGTALYPVADLALATEKFQRHNINESIYVVDVRQSLYFKQLFKILELMGYRQRLVHLSYDFVTLPSGMMSSRSGNVITYEELKSKILENITVETRKRHEDWTDSRIIEVAKRLTISIIKFEMLKVSPDKIITFDIQEASKFDGQTACYVQYGYARLKSIIRKQGMNWFHFDKHLGRLTEPKEKALLLKIAKYPETIMTAGKQYDPSDLTKYLFELVQLFNDYYHEVNILKAESRIKQARLALIKAIAQVLENGFDILGMKIIEEM